MRTPAISAQQSDPWEPSVAAYDLSIHHNPDAKAWADFFVAVFPGQTDKHELMTSWFANAMMVMHDHLKAQQANEVQRLREALTMFVHLAESRLRELGSLPPEMAKCLDRGRAALAASTEQEVQS